MNKQEIIDYAISLGFILDHDKWEDPSVNGCWLRFISPDNLLDERNLRWIWYKEDSDDDNINRGNYIRGRLAKKKEIQEFLKY